MILTRCEARNLPRPGKGDRANAGKQCRLTAKGKGTKYCGWHMKVYGMGPPRLGLRVAA